MFAKPHSSWECTNCNGTNFLYNTEQAPEDKSKCPVCPENFDWAKAYFHCQFCRTQVLAKTVTKFNKKPICLECLYQVLK